jgi:hypothetical protein
MSHQKVILIGGFGRSKALRERLETLLQGERNFDEEEIKLLLPATP